MAIHASRLSVWEIAHRWHSIDPDTSASAAQIPLRVKDTLRMLVSEVYLERLLSTLLRENEGVGDREMLKGFRIEDYGEKFVVCIEEGVIDVGFLKFLTIEHWEYEIWCKERGSQMPDWWVDPFREVSEAASIREESEAGPVGVQGKISNRTAGELEKLERASVEGAAKQVDTSGPEPSGLPETQASTQQEKQQQQAALWRYKRLYELKRDFADYLDEGNYPEKLFNKAALQFYERLPEKDQRVIAPLRLEGKHKENALRTLRQTAKEHRDNADVPWRKGLKT
jgi:hypothetical protein